MRIGQRAVARHRRRSLDALDPSSCRRDAATTAANHRRCSGRSARPAVRSRRCASCSSTAAGSRTTPPVSSSPRSATTTRATSRRQRRSCALASRLRGRRGQGAEARQPVALHAGALRRALRQREQLRRDLRGAPRGARARPRTASSSSARSPASSGSCSSRRPSTSRAPTSSRSSRCPRTRSPRATCATLPLLRHVAALRQADGRLDRRRHDRGGRPCRRDDPAAQRAALRAPVHRRLPGERRGAQPRRHHHLPRALPGRRHRPLRPPGRDRDGASSPTCSGRA